MIVILCCAFGIISALLIGLKTPKSYEGQFTITVNLSQTESGVGYQYEGFYGLQAADNIATTLLNWLPQKDVSNKIIENSDLISAEKLPEPRMTISKIGLRILQVRWVAKDESVINRLASATANIVQEKIKENASSSQSSYSASFEKPFITLASKSLRTLSLIGFLAGGVMGLILAFAIQFFNPIIQFMFEIESRIGKAPIFFASKKKYGNSFREADELRVLIDDNCSNKTVIFVPISKSNYKLPLLLKDLTDSYIKSGKKVNLVDADIFNGNLTKLYGQSGKVGLSDYLENNLVMSELNLPVSENINLLASGKLFADAQLRSASLPWEQLKAIFKDNKTIILTSAFEESIEPIRAAQDIKTYLIIELRKTPFVLAEQAFALWKNKAFDFEIIVLE